MPSPDPPSAVQPDDRDTSLAEAIVIEDLAEARLRRGPYSALGDVRCDYRDGVLTLRGRLSFQHHKQVAQELVAGVLGVREVVNRIEVIEPPDHPAP